MTVKIIELVCVLFCFLLFVTYFLLHRVTHDDSKQYLVLIMFVFYAMSVIYDLSVEADYEATHRVITLIRHFMIISSFATAVVYVRTLFADYHFTKITDGILFTLVVLYILYIVMIFLRRSIVLLNDAVIVTAILSLFLYIVFLVLRWNVLQPRNRILLVSMFINVLCFSLMEQLRLVGFKYKFVFCSGMIVYMVTYEIISFVKIFSLVSEDVRNNRKTSPTDDNPFALTKTEQEIVDLLRDGTLCSKELAEIMGKRPETIDRHIKNIMAKVGCNNRKDIVGIMDNGSLFIVHNS